MKNKKSKFLNNNDQFFQRSNEQYRMSAEISEDLIRSKSITKLNDEANKIENFDHPKEIDDYTIYDYDIENNRNHEWGNKER
jgi:hypothetical protein